MSGVMRTELGVMDATKSAYAGQIDTATQIYRNLYNEGHNLVSGWRGSASDACAGAVEDLNTLSLNAINLFEHINTALGQGTNILANAEADAAAGIPKIG